MAKKMVRSRGKKGNRGAPDCGDEARPGRLALPRELARVLLSNLPQGALGNGREEPVFMWPCGAVLQLGSDGRVLECRTPYNSAKSPCPFPTRSELAQVLGDVADEINKINAKLDAFAKWTQQHDEQMLGTEGMGVAPVRDCAAVAHHDRPEDDGNRVRSEVPDERVQSGPDAGLDGGRGPTDE